LARYCRSVLKGLKGGRHIHPIIKRAANHNREIMIMKSTIMIYRMTGRPHIGFKQHIEWPVERSMSKPIYDINKSDRHRSSRGLMDNVVIGPICSAGPVILSMSARYCRSVLKGGRHIHPIIKRAADVMSQ
jgi:hypothetical protein